MGIIGNALGDLHREDVCSSRLRSECRLGLVLRLLGCHDMEDRIKLTVVGNPDLIFLIPIRSAEIDEVIQEYGCPHGIAGAEGIQHPPSPIRGFSHRIGEPPITYEAGRVGKEMVRTWS